jgi:transcriptional regulator with XRE-family HTH domain
VPGVPRKKYDDEALRARALELRSQGLSYREIARELGCSVFKVHQLISPYESPRSRIKQVHELARMVDELGRRVDELNAKLGELEHRLSQLKPLEDMSKAVYDLRGDVDSLSTRILELEDAMDLIRESVSRRLRGRSECMYVDRNGYCTMWRWMSKVEGWDMREDVSGGRKVYYLNVRKHPLVCTSCPTYKPKQPS